MDRGIVVTPYFTFDGHSLHFPGLVGIESTNLKHYLLYWDKVEFPNNNIIHIGDSPEFEFLYNENVLQRTNININGFSGNIGNVYLIAQAEAIRKLNEQDPGKWTLGQNSSRLFVPDSLSKNTSSVEFELYNILPSPGDDVSYEEILNFKVKRKDELAEFRMCMDDIYIDITKSNDIPRSKNVALTKLEKSISNLNVVASESWSSKFLSGFKVDISIPNVIDNSVKGAGLAAMSSLPITLGAAAGAVASVMKFDFSTAPRVTGTKGLRNDFAYISSVNRDLKS
ncbi:DUF6236 family protein [Shewanella sp. SR43-8]|jgi:hypothetical protein|uniref:DUF6236 family protein n=1 Tax=Shewanella sp. SR43-8 TaxID=2760938 RepID=UPI0015FF45E8|nr:DUF6236 family protein [Shewanella sp. SR43-8]MBB1322489.1 hypothetical protein [Shewanella sp. SR43-8]